MSDLARPRDGDDLLKRLDHLNRIGIALSQEKDITRLLDMGMDPFNFADALLGILAQRLARRLCKCKEAHVATAEEIQALMDEFCTELINTESWGAVIDEASGEAKRLTGDAEVKRREIAQKKKAELLEQWTKEFGNEKGELILHTAKGCETCGNTGYKGRLGLHELLVGSDRIKKDIQNHARVAKMFATCLDEGMRTLKQDGIEKVLMGITDIQQVRAVCIK